MSSNFRHPSKILRGMLQLPLITTAASAPELQLASVNPIRCKQP